VIAGTWHLPGAEVGKGHSPGAVAKADWDHAVATVRDLHTGSLIAAGRVVPANAGIPGCAGFRVKPGMTILT